MKYKAIIMDLDGTTVPAYSNTVSPRVIDVIHKAHDHVFVSTATGRLLPDVEPIIDQLSLNGLCIINNGSQIYDPQDKKIVYELELDRSVIPQVISEFEKKKVTAFIFDGKKEQEGTNWEDYPHIVSLYVPNIPHELVAEFQVIFQDVPNIVVHRLLGNAPGTESIEVSNEQGTKQHGIFEVAKREGILTHEIIGVGDGYNDFPLLMACGLKIAMGNAVPELKAIADFIAPTVDEDGVAVVIEKFILGI